MIAFRATGQLLELLLLEGKRRRSRIIREALRSYYRKLGIWKENAE